ncbi:MAG: lytic transglycosylase domain-containing protein [Bdellovibrionota bacterium]
MKKKIIKLIIALFIFTVIFLVPSAFAKPIYVIRKNDGSVLITNRTPPKGTNAVVYTGQRIYNNTKSAYGNTQGTFSRVQGSNASNNSGYGGKLFLRYCDLIKDVSRYYNVSESLIRSVIHVESFYNPYAVSKKGAQGLMQLMPFVAKELGVSNPFVPEQNIEGGTRLLSKLLKKYNGNRALALAAYNAGEGAVDKFNGIPPYKETRDYVRKVLALQTRYERM